MTFDHTISTYVKHPFLYLFFCALAAPLFAQTYPSPNVVSCVDTSGNLVLAGSFDDEFVLAGSTIDEADGQTGIFVAQISTSGTLTWIVLFTSEDPDSEILVCTDSLDQVNVTLKHEATSSPYENLTLIGLEDDGDTRFVKKGSIPIGG